MAEVCRKEFIGAIIAGLSVGGTASEAKASATEARHDLGGGKVICLSNRSRSQMFSAVFVSPAGKVAVVDGGFFGDGDNLRSVLTSLGGKVDYWFFTHAHCDHFGAFVSMAEKGLERSGIRIGKLVFSFPESDWLQKAEPARAPHVQRFFAVLEKTSKWLPTERHPKGTTYDLGGGWTVKSLNDPSLERPSINDTSVCLSIMTGARKWLVTGDIGPHVGRRLVSELGTDLEHEFVFMSHHGQNGADKRFYAAVKPQVAIWPTPEWLWNNDSGKGPGSGPFNTNYTKCWLQELKVRQQYVLIHDVTFV